MGEPMNADRGFTKRKHPSGVWVCMYDDDPGTYLTESGDPLDESLAEEAGFDVKVDRKNKRRRELMAKKRAEVERELAALDAEEEGTAAPSDGEDAPEPPTPMTARSRTELRETDRFKMVHRGQGAWDIIDKRTDEVVRRKLSRQEGEAFLEADIAVEENTQEERAHG